MSMTHDWLSGPPPFDDDLLNDLGFDLEFEDALARLVFMYMDGNIE